MFNNTTLKPNKILQCDERLHIIRVPTQRRNSYKIVMFYFSPQYIIINKLTHLISIIASGSVVDKSFEKNHVHTRIILRTYVGDFPHTLAFNL